MISLYENGINGILADEMVSPRLYVHFACVCVCVCVCVGLFV